MESRLDTDNDWKKLLDDTAVEVDRLIRTNLNTFKKKVKPFAKRWKDHYSEIKRYHQERQDHWKKIKGDPQLRYKKKDQKPPRSPSYRGWEWDKHYLYDLPMGIGPTYEIPVEHVNKIIKSIKERIKNNKRIGESIDVLKQDLVDLQFAIKKIDPTKKKNAWIMAPRRWERERGEAHHSYWAFLWWHWLNLSDEEVFGCWRPPQKEIPEHPCARLMPPMGSDRLPAPRDESEEYERYYVVLASIHDSILTETKGATVDVWPKELAEQVWWRVSQGRPYGPGVPFIRIALERVKADLDTTQKNNSGKGKSRKTTGKPRSRPRVSDDHVKVERRRDLKKKWENYQSTGLKGASKEQFCKDRGISVAYLDDSVLRWCRNHPE